MKLLLCLVLLSIIHLIEGRLNEETTVRAMQAYQSISQTINESVNQSIKPGATVLNVTRPEGVRSFIVFASNAYLNSSAKLPLLLAYHGQSINQSVIHSLFKHH
jgi:hypothetical protein